MTTPGFDAAQARYDGAEPPEFDATDDPGTKCPGHTCEERHTCYMCNGVVCAEHDDVDDCDGYVVHHECHKDGCMSGACNEDRRDAALLEREGL